MTTPVKLVIPLAALLLVAGCATRPASTLTSAEAPEPARTVSADTATRTASIIIGPQSVESRNDEGTILRSFGFDEDPVAVIASLTSSLESTPTVVESAGGEGTDVDLPGRTYDWSGLVLIVPDYAATAIGDGSSDYRIEVTQPSVNEVSVQTSSGIAVGRSDQETRTVGEHYRAVSRPATDDAVPLESWSRPGPTGETWTDWVSVDLASGSVSRIRATLHDYGA